MDLEEKKDIIQKYNENIPIRKIAKIYKVSTPCIYKRLNRWGVRKKHGIRYLLSKLAQ